MLVLWQGSTIGERAPWWWPIAMRLLRPGFHHVMAIYYDPDGGAWVVVDPVFGGLQVRALVDSPSLTGHILADYPCTAWAVVRVDRHAYAPLVRGPLTCVSVIKTLLGIGGRSWTPWQLYCQLARSGWPNGQGGGIKAGTGAQ